MDLGRGLCGLREMSHVCWVGFPCILGSLERVTNVLFWKCYTESLSSTHRIMRRVLRSHTVKKTVYPSVSQIDLTTGNDLFPSNTSQDVSIPQNRVGEKPQEIVWFFFFPIFIVVVQSLSHVWLFVTSWTATHQTSCPPLCPGICSHFVPIEIIVEIYKYLSLNIPMFSWEHIFIKWIVAI